MTYLLDSNVLIHCFNARRQADLAAALSQVPCAIAAEVEHEQVRHPSRGAAFRAWFPGASLTIRAIELGSPSDELLSRLEAGLSSKRGRGERESIALAAADPALVFVAMDKNAMWLALRELWAPGERVIGLPVFLRRLVDAGAMPREAADDVMVQASKTQPMPIWWADW